MRASKHNSTQTYLFQAVRQKTSSLAIGFWKMVNTFQRVFFSILYIQPTSACPLRMTVKVCRRYGRLKLTLSIFLRMLQCKLSYFSRV